MTIYGPGWNRLLPPTGRELNVGLPDAELAAACDSEATAGGSAFSGFVAEELHPFIRSDHLDRFGEKKNAFGAIVGDAKPV